MRVAIVLVLLIAACGARSSSPSRPNPGTNPNPNPNPNPGPSNPTATGPRPARDDCTRVVDHVYAILLADPGLNDEQRTQLREQKPVASDAMMRQCLDELTRADVDCYLSKKDLAAMFACEKKQHHDMKDPR